MSDLRTSMLCAALMVAVASVAQGGVVGVRSHSATRRAEADRMSFDGAGTARPGPVGERELGLAKAPGRAIRPSPIKHVVIIYQENHSFDDLLGALCKRRKPTCDGYTGPVRFRDGKRAPNVREPDIPPGVAHSKGAQERALHNSWDRVLGCTTYPHRCVTHVPPFRIPNLARMATKYAVADRTFESLPTASWGSHLRLASGSPLGFWNGGNPARSVTGAKERDGWGCPSQRDAWWRDRLWVPACVPDRQGRGPYRRSPVPFHATLMQRLERKHLSWHIYQGVPRHHRPQDSIWQFCTYFYWCYRNRWDHRHVSTYRAYRLAARGARTMANVSFVLPTPPLSQHNKVSLKRGDNYIGRLVHAVMAGPRWKSSAIFITYDDCGCFYDHVKPPPGRGFREPMVIVSPWVKHAYTDAHTTTQPYGMQAFVEHNFGLRSLSHAVSRAYDYHWAFDFHQKPLTGIKTTTQPISAREKVRLRTLALTLEDEVS